MWRIASKKSPTAKVLPRRLQIIPTTWDHGGDKDYYGQVLTVGARQMGTEGDISHYIVPGPLYNG